MHRRIRLPHFADIYSAPLFVGALLVFGLFAVAAASVSALGRPTGGDPVSALGRPTGGDPVSALGRPTGGDPVSALGRPAGGARVSALGRPAGGARVSALGRPTGGYWIPGSDGTASDRAAEAYSPVGGRAPTDTASAPPIVSSVTFEGDFHFSPSELATRIRTSPNRRFLGIPGMTWWLWVYRLGSSGALGNRLGQALIASGEAPAYLDESVLSADLERLRLFYLQEGFREASVSARVDTLADRDRVRVTFIADAGRPTFVRQVSYEGLNGLDPEQQFDVARASLLRPVRVERQAPLRFDARDQRYSEPTLLEERRRLLAFLRNRGYAAVTRDSIRALIYPHNRDSFDVVFRIQTGPRYRFGGVEFDVQGPESSVRQRVDTLLVIPPSDSIAGGIVTAWMRREGRLAPALLARTLQFQPGDWYDLSSLLATKRRLEATGVFSFTDIVTLSANTAHATNNRAPVLPHRFELRTRRRHQIRLETFMLQRSSIFGASESELGTGLGISYENANLFGRGETFRLSTTGSVAADVSEWFSPASDTGRFGTVADRWLFTSAQAEVAASLSYPYLIGPFRTLEDVLGLYDARTRLSLSLLTARRADLGLILRGRGTGRLRLEMQHAPTVTSFFDLLDISLSNPDTLSNFQSTFLDNLLRPVDDPVQRAQIAEDYTQPQVNSVLRYTLRSARVNPLRRERGYAYEGFVEVGNNLMYLLDRHVYTPGTVEGSLPGLPFFESGNRDSRLAYRQYVRFVGDLRRYRPISARSVLATKLMAGIAHPTGRSDVVPFERRFYSGGASSVRGWGLRELGPGAARFVSSDSTVQARTGDDVTNIFGGDVKLEAGIELRSTLLRGVLAADWIAVAFADAGNVWFGPRNPGFGEGTTVDADGRFHFDRFYREIGVGSGAGLRVAWDYLIVRLDLAYKLYDPMQREEGFLPDGLRKIQPHFGIGHAF